MQKHKSPGHQQPLSLNFLVTSAVRVNLALTFWKMRNVWVVCSFPILISWIYFLIYESVLFQNNIKCALSDVTLTGMIPGYLQIIITDIIRLTSIIKKGWGLSPPYWLLTLVWIFDIILSRKYTWADDSWYYFKKSHAMRTWS